MNLIRKFPVATLGGIVGFLVMMLGTAVQMGLIPDRYAAWVALALAGLTWIGARLAHSVVTPLVEPKGADGKQLS